MTMAHAPCVLVPENAISHEAYTNKELDNTDYGRGADENIVCRRRSQFRNQRCNNSSTLMQDTELGHEELFQYPDSDTLTSLPTSDFCLARVFEPSNDLKNLHHGTIPIVLTSKESCDNTLLDHDLGPLSRKSVQGCTVDIKPELFQVGCKIDNPDSGIEKTPVLPNQSHFNFSHSPESTVSIPLSTYFWLLTTHRLTSHPRPTWETKTAYCRCHSWPGADQCRAFPDAPAKRQESVLSIGQCDDKRDRRLQSEAEFTKHELKTLIEGRVYDEETCEPQKKLPHCRQHCPLSPTEPVKLQRSNPQVFSSSAVCSKSSENNKISPPIPSSGVSSFQVNSFHLPSPSLISKSSLDQLTKELLRAKEIKKTLEEENGKLCRELQVFQDYKAHSEEKINLLESQVQKIMVQYSEELSALLSVKSSLETKVLEQEIEIRSLNENNQKLQRKLIVEKVTPFEDSNVTETPQFTDIRRLF